MEDLAPNGVRLATAADLQMRKYKFEAFHENAELLIADMQRLNKNT